MKHYLIPYIVADSGDWWTGIDFYNHNEYETNITIKIQRHSNGVLANTINETIKPWSHFVLYKEELSKNLIPDDAGRATILIDCSDDVYITTFMGKNEGFGLVPHFEIIDLKK